MSYPDTGKLASISGHCNLYAVHTSISSQMSSHHSPAYDAFWGNCMQQKVYQTVAVNACSLSHELILYRTYQVLFIQFDPSGCNLQPTADLQGTRHQFHHHWHSGQINAYSRPRSFCLYLHDHQVRLSLHFHSRLWIRHFVTVGLEIDKRWWSGSWLGLHWIPSIHS